MLTEHFPTHCSALSQALCKTSGQGPIHTKALPKDNQFSLVDLKVKVFFFFFFTVEDGGNLVQTQGSLKTQINNRKPYINILHGEKKQQ